MSKFLKFFAFVFSLHMNFSNGSKFKEDNFYINIVSFLDGTVSAFSPKGRVLWSQKLSDDPLVKLFHKPNQDNEFSPVILPSDNGFIEFYDDTTNRYYNIDIDWLLTNGDEIKFGQYFITSEKTVNIFAIDLLTGKQIYKCIGNNCDYFPPSNNSNAFLDSTSLRKKYGKTSHSSTGQNYDDFDFFLKTNSSLIKNNILILKRVKLSIHLFESFTGIERWNLSLGKYLLDIVQKKDLSYNNNIICMPQMILIDKSNYNLMLSDDEIKFFIDDHEVSSLWKVIFQLQSFSVKKKINKNEDFDISLGNSLTSHEKSSKYLLNTNYIYDLWDPQVEYLKGKLSNNIIGSNSRRYSSDDFTYFVNLRNVGNPLWKSMKYLSTSIDRKNSLDFLKSNKKAIIEQSINLNWPLIHSMTKNDRRLLRHLSNVMIPISVTNNHNEEKENNRLPLPSVNHSNSFDLFISAPQYWNFIIKELWKEILFLSVIVALVIQITIYSIRKRFRNVNLTLAINISTLNEFNSIEKNLPFVCEDETFFSLSSINNLNQSTQIENESTASIYLHNNDFPLSKSRFENDFEQINLIGYGGFGKVFKARNRVNGCFYAIKRIEIPDCEMAKRVVLREVTALSNLEHPGIVRFYNAWFDIAKSQCEKISDFSIGKSNDDRVVGTDDQFNATRSSSVFGNFNRHTSTTTVSSILSSEAISNQNVSKNRNHKISLVKTSLVSSKKLSIFSSDGSERVLDCQSDAKHNCFHTNRIYLFIQMQLCLRETLREWLLNNLSNRPKPIVYNIFKQILLAIDYLHDKGLVHRDLKPSNIFFAPDGTVKIGDFGLVSCFSTFTSTNMTSLNDSFSDLCADNLNFVGTELYMSPELIQNQPYDCKIDIYALGLIFIEMLIPFQTQMERHKTLIEAKKGNYSCSNKAHFTDLEIIKSMLSIKPCQRPYAKSIYKSIQTNENYSESSNIAHVLPLAHLISNQ